MNIDNVTKLAAALLNCEPCDVAICIGPARRQNRLTGEIVDCYAARVVTCVNTPNHWSCAVTTHEEKADTQDGAIELLQQRLASLCARRQARLAEAVS